MRLIQNLSYPYDSLRHRVSSINSAMDASEFPCTWGTFFAVSLLCAMLPPGSQAAVRDISEAFRSIPLHDSQWPGVVVRTGEDCFDVDVCAMFGGRTCVGVYGTVADAAADIMRAHGLGPLIKWVDDHLFYRILRIHLVEFNRKRDAARKRILQAGGRRSSGGRLWYAGSTLPDDRVEEFVEDFAFALVDHSHSSPRSADCARFTYSFADIDAISKRLGLLWTLDKDQWWCTAPTFTGCVWDLIAWLVSLAPEKVAKYLEAIKTFRAQPTHTLRELQSLYGKLHYTTQVVPSGRPYLLHLERAMAAATDRPYVPRRACVLAWHDFPAMRALN